MNANYIYDIFETTGKHNAPDLNIGLAMLKADKPIPEGMTDQGVREFMGRHYEALVEGYKARDGKPSPLWWLSARPRTPSGRRRRYDPPPMPATPQRLLQGR